MPLSIFQNYAIHVTEQSKLETRQTDGVKTLVGNPKKAIMKLAWPMMFAMSVQLMYNLIGAFWVSGLGVNALSAVGFFFPFFFGVMALAMGIGTGGGAAVSRYIGAEKL
jgi:Na+-driven multidrug efflux pump